VGPAKSKDRRLKSSRGFSKASEQAKNVSQPDNETFFHVPHLVTDSSEVGHQKIRVLVADDQMLIRAGICQLIRTIPNVIVVGEASDGQEALRLIGLHLPDIVLMDIAMPGMNGLEALVLARQQFPSVQIIILSEHANDEFIARALRGGAVGFVVKDDSAEELYAAIQAVAIGDSHLSNKKPLHGLARTQSIEGPAIHLTPRQRQILQHVAQGDSTKEIARLLGISVNTVKTHRLKLMEKVGVHEISGLVRYAAKLGLIHN
jgi:DNA-binding NarL/FixJ family response regulator